jgi:pimeloyl-ACP methyl ester carboxylesterase
MPKIKANQLDFHYWQSGQGRDLVLIHGLGGNLAGWHLDLVPELQREYRVTTYDLRGHGRTEATGEGYTTRDMVDDLRALMDALGIEDACLVGNSWGADIALHFALLHPQRVWSLVLIEPALLAPLASTYRRQEWSGWEYASKTVEALSGEPIPESRRFDLEYLLQQLLLIPILFGPSKGRPRDAELVTRVADVLRPMWEGEGENQDGELTPETVHRIRSRTILIYEGDSIFLEANELLRDRLPDCETAVLPSAGIKHFTGLENPGLILEHALRFLRSAPDSPPMSNTPE